MKKKDWYKKLLNKLRAIESGQRSLQSYIDEVKGKIPTLEEEGVREVDTFEYRRSKIISRFKNGQERYRNSPSVNMVVNCLARGDDPVPLIDQLLQNNEDLVEELTKTKMQLDGREKYQEMIQSIRELLETGK